MKPAITAPPDPTRRTFLKQVATATVLLSTAQLLAQSTSAQTSPAATPATGPAPWHRRAIRWGQTNIAENDIERYDIPWWRKHWKRTETQGIIVNAGGIVAYYPSKFPLHYRPPTLGNRDLFGDLAKAAHDDGLAVIARMDSSKVRRPVFDAHPDWIAMNANGQPLTSGEFYVTCINGGWYQQFLPDVMREIIDRFHPEGFADNSWASTDRNTICYCANCTRLFQAFANMPLPTARNWNDPAFRKWIEWSYARRLEQWDFNNKITQEAGGKDCLWLGMQSADIASQASTFRDSKEIFARSQVVLLDKQSRSISDGFVENIVDGHLVHSLAGWDKVVPESMAQYQHGSPSQYRLAAKSPPEAQLWMYAGIAGGIQPWWHYVNAYHEDRRIYKTALPVMAWHKANEQYLINRRPLATVAIGWSQRNMDFFGRDNADELVNQPFRGWVHALTRARIPFLPLHLDHLDRDADTLAALILPNIGILSDTQVAAIRRFVAKGGGLIVTGQTGLHDQYGDPLPDFALADLMGVKGGRPVAAAGRGRGAAGAAAGGGGGGDQHTYLRLTPELQHQFDGPGEMFRLDGNLRRHPALAGLDETDILAFGGNLAAGLTVNPGFQTLLTFIPSFPVMPPEEVIMRTPLTTIPGLVVTQALADFANRGGPVAYLAADLDRRFAMDNFPDHGTILANLARWAARDNIPLQVQGPGLIACVPYQQPTPTGTRMILHLVNLTSSSTWRSPMHEFIPIGPLQIKLTLPKAFTPKTAQALVSNQPLTLATAATTVTLELKSLLDHELIILE